MICSKNILVVLAGATLANVAGAETINFDDLLNHYVSGPQDTAGAFGSFYADRGMIMSARDTLWLGNGLAAGDTGNFSIDGTNGPGFISLFVPNAEGWVTFSFNSTVNISMDLIATFEGNGGDVLFNVIGSQNGDEVINSFETLTDPVGDPDGEATSYNFSGVDSLTFQLGPNSDRVLAFDNFVFSPVPAPGALALLGFGGLVGARRRR